MNVVARCADDTSLRAAQAHLLAADDEVDASVSGNDGGAVASRRTPLSAKAGRTRAVRESPQALCQAAVASMSAM